jgi:hypothetical protein
VLNGSNSVQFLNVACGEIGGGANKASYCMQVETGAQGVTFQGDCRGVQTACVNNAGNITSLIVQPGLNPAGTPSSLGIGVNPAADSAIDIRQSNSGSDTRVRVTNPNTANGTQARLDLSTGSTNAFTTFTVQDGTSLQTSIINGAGLTGGILFDSHQATGAPIQLFPATGQNVIVGSNGTTGGVVALQGSTSGQGTLGVTATGGTLQFNGGALAVASGGTGDTGTAWSSFTPSLACGTATFTVNGAKTKSIGKTTFMSLDFTITALGTCTNALTFNLPSTTNSAISFMARDGSVSAKTLSCANGSAATNVTCQTVDVVNFVVNARFQGSTSYESQ